MSSDTCWHALTGIRLALNTNLRCEINRIFSSALSNQKGTRLACATTPGLEDLTPAS
jgi:hypothetical protein